MRSVKIVALIGFIGILSSQVLARVTGDYLRQEMMMSALSTVGKTESYTQIISPLLHSLLYQEAGKSQDIMDETNLYLYRIGMAMVFEKGPSVFTASNVLLRYNETNGNLKKLHELSEEISTYTKNLQSGRPSQLDRF